MSKLKGYVDRMNYRVDKILFSDISELLFKIMLIICFILVFLCFVGYVASLCLI